MNGAPPRSAFRLLAGLLAALALCFAAASPAEARTYRTVIRPSQLVPFRNLQGEGRTSAFATGNASGWAYYYYPLSIPRGKVLTGLTFKYVATGVNNTTVELARAKPDAVTPLETVFAGYGIGTGYVPGADFTPIAATATGVSRKVARGYTYFVSAGFSNGSGAVAEIVVRYRDP